MTGTWIEVQRRGDRLAVWEECGGRSSVRPTRLHQPRSLHVRADKEAPQGYPWQNVDRLKKQWRKSFEVDLLDGLDAPTVKTLRLAVTRRHVFEHNGGVIDDDYVGQPA
jgi:hypothetical protein